jgi:flagellar motility protein MotE (MotC chaperone)
MAGARLPRFRFTPPRFLPVVAVALGAAAALRFVAAGTEIRATWPEHVASAPAIAYPGRTILSIETAAGDEQKKTEAPGGRRPIDDDVNFTSSEVEVLQALAKRRAEIDKRADDLHEREALLKAAEQQIERKLKELKEIQANLEATLRKHDQEEVARRKSLVKVFEGMKPAEAAKIFDQMELLQLVDIVERMKEKSVSAIFAQMHPVRARQVASEIAKRKEPAAARPRS